VYDQIKKQNPSVQIHIVAGKSNGELIKQDKNIDKLFILKNKSYILRIKMAMQLRKHHYDVLFEANPTTLRNRDLLFIRLVKASINIGYSKENYKLFNLNLTSKKNHTAFIYQQMMQLLGFESNDTTYIIPEDKKASEESSAFLNTLSNKNIIAVNLLGASRSRKFIKENAIVLLNNILSTFPNHTIVLLTYPEVNSWIKEIIDTLQTNRVTSFLGTTSIFHTIAIIKKSSLVITPDTVAVHIADAYDIPLVAFYSMEEENFIYWHSIQPNAVIVRYQYNINQLEEKRFKDSLQQASAIIIP
jgi:ADP-heptose:LPS heptosyltransferase